AVMAIGVVVGSLIGTFMGWAAPISRWTSYVGDKILKSFRFDPGSIVTAWRRDKAKYEKLFDDLKDQGWSDDRIEALKFVTEFTPSASLAFQPFSVVGGVGIVLSKDKSPLRSISRICIYEACSQ
ncbi:unnamed protein product, partial [marine sediment metagenome]